MTGKVDREVGQSAVVFLGFSIVTNALLALSLVEQGK